ncbi:MAG: acyl carrier protein [Candidatus Nanoarchaeia archaeon]|nr:acyl carrier protein [Candidatus Nanoarchaeia archaeon]
MLEREVAFTKAMEVFKKAGCKTEGVNEDMTLEQAGADSIGMCEVAHYTDKDLGVKIPDKTLADLTTVRDYVDYLMANLK